MTYGPIDILAIEFPDNTKLLGEGLAELIKLVENGAIRIIDLLVVMKDADGNVAARELQELAPALIAVLDPLKPTVTSLVSMNDVEALGAALAPNTTAGIMLYENLWAIKFKEAILKADARLILQERIPNEVIVEELADISVLASSTG
jgi:hypothetical protein